jgi:hypothetical protein
MVDSGIQVANADGIALLTPIPESNRALSLHLLSAFFESLASR